jgi:hypothetical protein
LMSGIIYSSLSLMRIAPYPKVPEVYLCTQKGLVTPYPILLLTPLTLTISFSVWIILIT